jgi:hypothetical protein
MSSPNNYDKIKSITTLLSEDLPTLQDISPETPVLTQASSSSTKNSIVGFFSNISWQTWIIIILLLALIGINVFAYLAKGTQATATIFDQIFGPILKLFGYETIETTKQTIQTTATGTTAGVNSVADTSVNALNQVEKNVQNGPSSIPLPTSGTSVGLSTATSPSTSSQTQNNGGPVPTGQLASTSQPGVSLKQQNAIEGQVQQYKEDTLEKALSNASQSVSQQGSVQPYDTTGSTGKAGWCFIGEDLGVRTCSQVGVNDVCMSGDVFPSQEICMNPNLRA